MVKVDEHCASCEFVFLKEKEMASVNVSLKLYSEKGSFTGDSRLFLCSYLSKALSSIKY